MVRWMCIVTPEDRISAEELRTRLKLNSVREFLQFRGQSGHLERMEGKIPLSSKCSTLKFSCSFPRGRPRKTWNKIIRSDQKERKVSKDLVKDKNF